MGHLLFLLYLLAFAAGVSGITLAVMIYLRHRKVMLRYYALFLLALLLIITAMGLQLYGRLTGLPLLPVDDVGFVVSTVGALLFVADAPFLVHGLLGLELTSFKKTLFWAVDGVAGVAALTFALTGFDLILYGILNPIMFGTVAYVLIVTLTNMRNIADASLRKGLWYLFVVSAVFFPLMLVDSFIERLVSMQQYIGSPTLTLFYITINVMGFFFSRSYFDRPVYVEDGKPSDYFVRSFGITPREAEIIPLLSLGMSNSDIGEKLFISLKTVENHVYNIYQKTGVRNRVQLFNLIRANSREGAA